MKIEWATICDGVTESDGKQVIHWPLIQGAYADVGGGIGFTVAVAIAGDYEHMGVGRHTMHHKIFAPDMSLHSSSDHPWILMLDPSAVPGMKAGKLIPINIWLESVILGTYTISISLDGGDPWTLSYVIAPWPEYENPP